MENELLDSMGTFLVHGCTECDEDCPYFGSKYMSKRADAALIEAEGQAQANAKPQGSLTEQIIRQRAIEKWDGKLPQYEMSGGSSTILNLK